MFLFTPDTDFSLKSAFCLCSEQARPILWEEEDQIDLRMHQNIWT